MGIDTEVFIDEHKISKQFICAICQVRWWLAEALFGMTCSSCSVKRPWA